MFFGHFSYKNLTRPHITEHINKAYSTNTGSIGKGTSGVANSYRYCPGTQKSLRPIANVSFAAPTSLEDGHYSSTESVAAAGDVCISI